MQFTILFLVFIPLIEIYFMIKIGAVIGAFNTILATIITAVAGLYFVKLQGISTVYSAINSMRSNQAPMREVLGGFCLIIAAICLIIPGFVTDTLGALLVIPFTRNLILKFFVQNKEFNNQQSNDNTIEIEAEEIDDRDRY
jgi:UPF0716 protein FxsA